MKLPKDVVLRKRITIKNNKMKKEIFSMVLSGSSSEAITSGVTTSTGVGFEVEEPGHGHISLAPKSMLNENDIKDLNEIVKEFRKLKRTEKEIRKEIITELIEKFDSCKQLMDWYKVIDELKSGLI